MKYMTPCILYWLAWENIKNLREVINLCEVINLTEMFHVKHSAVLPAQRGESESIMKKICAESGRTFVRVSRWISVKDRYITTKHRLYDYADIYGCEKGKALLRYFTYKGVMYAIAQFMRLSYPEFYTMDDGKTGYLSGYDSTDYYRPLFIEIDETGERVRL